MAEKKIRKEKVRITKGKAYVASTFNNTIITLTDMSGNVLASSSAGVVGFKGARKSTPFAASRVAEDAVLKSQKYGLSDVDVFISGPGMGRQMALPFVILTFSFLIFFSAILFLLYFLI